MTRATGPSSISRRARRPPSLWPRLKTITRHVWCKTKTGGESQDGFFPSKNPPNGHDGHFSSPWLFQPEGWDYYCVNPGSGRNAQRNTAGRRLRYSAHRAVLFIGVSTRCYTGYIVQSNATMLCLFLCATRELAKDDSGFLFKLHRRAIYTH